MSSRGRSSSMSIDRHPKTRTWDSGFAPQRASNRPGVPTAGVRKVKPIQPYRVNHQVTPRRLTAQHAWWKPRRRIFPLRLCPCLPIKRRSAGRPMDLGLIPGQRLSKRGHAQLWALMVRPAAAGQQVPARVHLTKPLSAAGWRGHRGGCPRGNPRLAPWCPSLF